MIYIEDVGDRELIKDHGYVADVAGAAVTIRHDEHLYIAVYRPGQRFQRAGWYLRGPIEQYSWATAPAVRKLWDW